MTQEYTITAFSENSVGLLNRITIIFTRRRLNIESLTVSASSIRGIHKFTIVVKASREQVEKVTKQLEKLVEVLRAYFHTNSEIIHQEVALYKVNTSSLMIPSAVEEIVRHFRAHVLDVTTEYIVFEKTGYSTETQELFDYMDARFKVVQFTRSGRIAVTKDPRERLTDYLREMEAIENARLKQDS